MYLRESAARIFSDLATARLDLSWTDLKEELYKTYEPKNMKSLIFNRLNDLKQLQCESLEIFAEKFKSLATQLDDMSENTKISLFIRNLNQNIKTVILNYEKPETLINAICKANEINTNIAICSQPDTSGFRVFNTLKNKNKNDIIFDRSNEQYTDRWCSFHQTDTHDSSDCRINHNSRSPNQFNNQPNRNGRYYRWKQLGF